MATWKKIIVSGSTAELQAVSASAPVGFFGTASWALTASVALNATSPVFNISGSTGNASFSANGDTLRFQSGNGLTIAVTDNGGITTASIGATTDNVTFNNVIVDGDLTVNGTTTTINTTNLLVEDKFVLLASGSTSNTDGGIIVQNNGAGSGFGYFLDDVTTPRWGFTSSLAHGATSATADEYAVSAKSAAGTWTAGSPAPTYGGSAQGYGNIVVDANGDIWMYV